MNPLVITWSSGYYEDLGEQDEAGFYDYAYCYFIYFFRLPDGAAVSVRRYTDTPSEGAVYAATRYLPHPRAAEAAYLAAILRFLGSTQGITTFVYLAQTGYEPLPWREWPLSEIAVSFVEVSE